QHLAGLKFKPSLFSRAAFDIQLAPALITPADHPHQFSHSAATVAKVESFFNQSPNRFNGPSAAHLSAWHRFLLKQLTELVQFIRLQATLTMLPSPARIIFQTVQTLLLIAFHPTANRLFINKENVGGLTLTVSLGH